MVPPPYPVVTLRGYLESDYLEEPYLAEAGVTYAYGMQVNMLITPNNEFGMQTEMFVTQEPPYGQQAEMVVSKEVAYGMQTEMVISVIEAFGQQVEMFVTRENHYGMQVLMIVSVVEAYGQQVLMLIKTPFSFQATMVIYNDTQFRVLHEFPSRGTPALDGENWTATNQAAGDFSPNNLNTDVEEEVYRSTTLSIELTCDTGIPQGTTIDTLAIRNHNLTRSAQVQVQGSKDNFASVDVNFDLDPITLQHTYYIAPTFPLGIENQNRYWRVVITDVTNPAGYIQIGCIIFGNAKIFSTHENFSNPLRRGYIHFKDEIATEGFTRISNDRALKKTLRLAFQKLERIRGNYQWLEAYWEFARTSLKCLVIPMPKYAARYAVFAKLDRMPEIDVENVANMDDPDGRAEYLDFDLSWDESK